MHEAIIPALLIGFGIVAVGIFGPGAIDMVNNAMSVNSLEATKYSVTYFDSENRLILTVKNVGSSTVDVTAVVYAEGGITSNPVAFSNAIEKSETQAVSEILTVFGTTTPMNVLRDKEVSISINGTTFDGSVIQLDPILVKVQ